MNVILTHDLHGIISMMDGKCYTTGNTWYQSWNKYFSSFEDVAVLARMTQVQQPPSSCRRLDGKRVSILALKEFGAGNFSLRNIFTNIRVIRKAVAGNEALIIRAGLIGNLAFLLKPWRKPFALEVVSDPHDVFSADAFHHPLRPLIKFIYVLLLKIQCKTASSVLYVTESSLQKTYPASASAYTVGCSDVELTDECYITDDEISIPKKEKISIICVGNFYQIYKGQDDLIKAVAICRKNGFDIKLILAGSGKYLSYLQKLAEDLMIADHVEFPGPLAPGEEVRNWIDKSDIFVLPSRCEGLPRALLEAMARGKVCIGTEVGGIPELLHENCLVHPNNPQMLSIKIEEIVKNYKKMSEMALMNLYISKKYRIDLLTIKRNEFYKDIAIKTHKWVKGF